LFRAFGKLDLGGKNYMNPQGVGLGLVISNSLAKMLGPKARTLNIDVETSDKDEAPGIQFESEPNKGAKFWFRIEDQANKSGTQSYIVPFEGLKRIDIPTFETARSDRHLLTLENSSCH